MQTVKKFQTDKTALILNGGVKSPLALYWISLPVFCIQIHLRKAFLHLFSRGKKCFFAFII